MLRHRAAILGVVASAVLIQSAPLDVAHAATSTGWAQWAPLSGSSNVFTTVLRLPAAGFPPAQVSSTSRAPAQLPSGVNTFLGGAGDRVPTPVGLAYGSSRGQPYLALRPEADTPTAPSRTTYTFAEPTPSAGWTFVLGDIDADKVQITAKDADGTPLPPAQIDPWFRGSFNSAGESDRPVWDAGTATLTGNPQAVDTDGAAAWFEPDVALSELTLVYTRRAGFPVYQTWFASRARTIRAVLTDSSTAGHSCPLDQATLVLISPWGQELASAHPTASGDVEFGEYALAAGYTVRVDRPPGCALTGDEQTQVSNVAHNAAASFDVHAIVPQPVSGTLRTTDGTPVPGVEVSLTPPGGGPARVTTTDETGAYLFDDNAIGTGYTVAVTQVPAGFVTSGAASRTVDIASTPVTGQDFTLRELPAISGVVTDGGTGVGGVTVTRTPAGGATPVTTVTQGDGSYVFDHVPAGTYDISVTPPPGYDPVAPRNGVTVDSTDVADQSFALSRPGAVGGTVLDATTGRPIPGAALTVTGNGTTHSVHTDGAGDYFLAGLGSGTYVITVEVPAADQASGPVTRTVDITSAGEIRSRQDFRLIETFPVSGDVRSESSPVADAGVAITGSDGTLAGSTTTARDGTFAVPGLVPGDYLAAVTPPRGFPGPKPPSRPFTVVDGPVRGLDFALVPVIASPPGSPTGPATGTPTAAPPGLPTTPPSSGAGGNLASTGAPVDLLVPAVALVVIGGVLVVIGRRRPPRHR